ncbi:cellulase family glycosylhydrolase [Marinimicrobium locisalis]|uniref:cellulase family glycosylhydrolase n=1 Tax=Marinimicrobium locisalis TaxID=546022 RepID=UPI003221FFC7
MRVMKKALLGATICATALSTAMSVQAGFQVSGTQLLDDNGNPFLIRGINHPHTWFTSRTEQALQDIASVNANSVRIVLSDGQRWNRNSASDVAQLIEWCKENDLVAILEVHDVTGSGEESAAGDMSTTVDYWLDIASALQGEEGYVIINIANEPFGNDVPESTWINEHVEAIQRLREAGLTHTLLVDAANWGQDWQHVMRDNASTVAAADELNNTMFSVHMYEVYQDRSTIENYVSTFLDTHNLPLIVGEFGADHYGNDVDEESILAVAEQYDIGYVGWSWSGNSSEVDSLDIALNWDVNNLSSWGDFLINSSNGLRATAETASVYGGQSSSSPSSSVSSSASESSSTSSSISSSASSSVSSVASGQQCDWYGTLYPLCEDAQSGWGWENNESCLAPSTCQSQPAPYGIVGEGASSASAPASSSASSNSSVSSSTVYSSSSSSSQPAATGSCEYLVNNEWSSGYTGAIRIHNDGNQALSGWSVNWEYSDGSQVTNGWNAQIEGSNPYSATDMGWNGTIQPGQSVEFGFQVSKGGESASVPAVTGGPCD